MNLLWDVRVGHKRIQKVHVVVVVVVVVVVMIVVMVVALSEYVVRRIIGRQEQCQCLYLGRDNL